MTVVHHPQKETFRKDLKKTLVRTGNSLILWVKDYTKGDNENIFLLLKSVRDITCIEIPKDIMMNILIINIGT